MFARDIVEAVLKKGVDEAQMAGEPIPQIDPTVIDAMIAQQIAETLEQLSPLLMPPQQPDPLVQIRQQELQNDSTEIQRKMQNDQMDFQVDQAKLMQAYELAQQRLGLQEQVAEDRNQVNVYRINTQAALKGRG